MAVDRAMVDRIVAACRDAALAGQAAPSNAALVARFGFRSTATPSGLLTAAEALGLVVVERGMAQRVVSAPDGSWRTAGAVGATHWRAGIGAVNPVWTDRMLADLREMCGKGRSYRAIGQVLGVSAETARRKAIALGLVACRTAGEKGAAAVAKARAANETLRAEAFRRHAQQGGGVALPGPAAQPIPAPPLAVSGVPARAGYPEAAVGCGGLDVSSLTLPPPAVVTPRPGVFSSVGGRTCQWPMWGDRERATGVFCGAKVRRKPGGEPCVYCAEHAARAFTCRSVDAGPVLPMRGTAGWGGRAA